MKPRRNERGFALLLVFLLAACVAITLYMEIPRVAFEAERQRELLLMDRGNQFKRAIQVFVTDKTNNPTRRYPASIDELENFNNHRYLRHRYVDPMTGKDEWRLVHINGGILTDSVTTQGPKGSGSTSSTPNPPDYISQQAGMDSGTTQGSGGGVTRALIRRPNDSAPPGTLGADANMPPPGGAPGMQGNGGGVSASGMPSLPPVAGGVPGGRGGPGGPGGPGGQAPICTAYIGGCAPVAGSGQPGQPGLGPGLPPQPGNPVNSQGGGMSPSYPIGAGSNGNAPGYPQQGIQMNPQAQSAAASMITDLLTKPRPGGMPSGMPGTTVGGGIAGVASKFEAEGIMVVNEKTAINEWEYIFDMSKYRVPPNPVGGTPGTVLQPMGGSPPGTPMQPMGGTPPGPTKPGGNF